MALQDIPKKKTRPLDPKFNVEIKPARKKAIAKRAAVAIGNTPAANKLTPKPAAKKFTPPKGGLAKKDRKNTVKK